MLPAPTTLQLSGLRAGEMVGAIDVHVGRATNWTRLPAAYTMDARGSHRRVTLFETAGMMIEGRVTIREATLGDADTLVEFNALLAIESEGKQLDRPTLLAGVRRALGRPELCRYFLAESAAVVVGQVMVTFEMSDWRDGLVWWLQSVYVPPEHRRRGVFRALYGHVEQLARSASDGRGLRLYVDRRNHHAIATYEQMGMHDAGYLLYETDWSGAVQKVAGDGE